MELDVRMLRDSRFAAQVTGDGFRAGVLLWCAAWHQVPAGSLPDDDIELANLAGYGRFIKEWKKIRTEALYGFVMCSDGRLYHPAVAAKAAAAWQGRLEYAYKKLDDRLRKENKKRISDGRDPVEVPSFEEWNAIRYAGFPQEYRGIPAEIQQPNSGIPQEEQQLSTEKHRKTLLEGEGEGKGKGKGEYINPAASPAGDAQAPTHTRDRDPRERFGLDADWQPSPQFPTKLVMAGVVPENLLTVSNLAEFVSYWRADGATKTHAQWEHTLLKNLIAIRDRSLGGARHATQNRTANSQRLTSYERVQRANSIAHQPDSDDAIPGEYSHA